MTAEQKRGLRGLDGDQKVHLALVEAPGSTMLISCRLGAPPVVFTNGEDALVRADDLIEL